MKLALTLGFVAMTLLTALLVCSRARLDHSSTRLQAVQERAHASGNGESE
jgi:hypothetical protein